jgi:hypothetical protein
LHDFIHDFHILQKYIYAYWAYSWLGYHFLNRKLKDFIVVIYETTHGINLSAIFLKIHMVVVFSHVYVIMHQYFGKKTKNEKNEYISFYRQVDKF